MREIQPVAGCPHNRRTWLSEWQDDTRKITVVCDACKKTLGERIESVMVRDYDRSPVVDGDMAEPEYSKPGDLPFGKRVLGNDGAVGNRKGAAVKRPVRKDIFGTELEDMIQEPKRESRRRERKKRQRNE